VRVVIAEDLFLLRDGLVRLVEAYGHTVVAAVDNGPAVTPALLEHRPDVSIVDVRLPPTFSDEGLKAALAARREVPGLPVLILSTHVEQLYARELLADDRGGIGYLLKDRVMDAAEFMDALGRVAGGGTALDPAVISKLLGSTGRRPDHPIADLTERERSVLELMAEGLSNTAIAARLFLSEGAISKYTTSIFGKLGLTDDEDTNRRVRAVLAYLGAHRLLPAIAAAQLCVAAPLLARGEVPPWTDEAEDHVLRDSRGACRVLDVGRWAAPVVRLGLGFPPGRAAGAVCLRRPHRPGGGAVHRDPLRQARVRPVRHRRD
jgi:DNA-binding NarL/FixJ family response regulator